MIFVPQATSLNGWIQFQSNIRVQEELHSLNPLLSRNASYFEKNANQISSVDGLLNDARIRRVAVDAFGLSEDFASQAFLRKILNSSSSNGNSFAFSLQDQRYRDFWSNFSQQKLESGHMSDVNVVSRLVDRYYEATFEESVGEQNSDFRLGLVFERRVGEISSEGGAEQTQWFKILASKPVVEVLKTALGFGSGFSNLDIDRQVTEIRSSLQRKFNIDTVSDMAQAVSSNDVLRSFFVKRQLGATSIGSSLQNALTLLRAN